MDVVNMHEAKTHLSKLVERVAAGETVILARAGTPVAKLAPLDPPPAPDPSKRFGFMKGRISVPDDFDTMCADEIREMFEGPLFPEDRP